MEIDEDGLELSVIVGQYDNRRVYSTGLQGTSLAENTAFKGYHLLTYINYR